MTYCVGLMLHDGLVLIADTRSNAGVDNISTSNKMYVFERPGERVMALMVAGNLSLTQSVVDILTEGIANPETGEMETLIDSPGMFAAAQLVGRAVRQVYESDGAALAHQGVGFDISLILAGQIAGGRMRLFMIYNAGNFIEATEETPFLQIGEHKYGKPILDRAVTAQTSLLEGAKLGLLSMDSTLRSNLTVGLPIDVAIIPRDQCRVAFRHRITDDDESFRALRHQWSEALRLAHRNIPMPQWLAKADLGMEKTGKGRQAS
jgi:putative proteasome-type protease